MNIVREKIIEGVMPLSNNNNDGATNGDPARFFEWGHYDLEKQYWMYSWNDWNNIVYFQDEDILDRIGTAETKEEAKEIVLKHWNKNKDNIQIKESIKGFKPLVTTILSDEYAEPHPGITIYSWGDYVTGTSIWSHIYQWSKLDKQTSTPVKYFPKTIAREIVIGEAKTKEEAKQIVLDHYNKNKNDIKESVKGFKPLPRSILYDESEVIGDRTYWSTYEGTSRWKYAYDNYSGQVLFSNGYNITKIGFAHTKEIAKEIVLNHWNINKDNIKESAKGIKPLPHTILSDETTHDIYRFNTKLSSYMWGDKNKLNSIAYDWNELTKKVRYFSIDNKVEIIGDVDNIQSARLIILNHWKKNIVNKKEELIDKNDIKKNINSFV